jgi:hypothetical protein
MEAQNGAGRPAQGYSNRTRTAYFMNILHVLNAGYASYTILS